MGKNAQEKYQNFREWKNAQGAKGENLDPTPIEIPGDKCIPLTLKEEMQRFIRSELSQVAAEKDDEETFEEFDDMSIPDDDEMDGFPTITEYTVLEGAETPYLIEKEQENDEVKLLTKEENHTEDVENPSPEDTSEASGGEAAEDTRVPAG